MLQAPTFLKALPVSFLRCTREVIKISREPARCWSAAVLQAFKLPRGAGDAALDNPPLPRQISSHIRYQKNRMQEEKNYRWEERRRANFKRSVHRRTRQIAQWPK